MKRKLILNKTTSSFLALSLLTNNLIVNAFAEEDNNVNLQIEFTEQDVEDNGKSEDTEDDGTSKDAEDDGTSKDAEDDGTSEDTENDGTSEDAEDDGTSKDAEDDGTSEDTENDGTSEDTENDGTSEDVENDGTSEDAEDDGTSEDTENDGTSEDTENDGTSEDTENDGTSEDAEDDGTSEDTENDVTSEDAEDDGTSKDVENDGTSKDTEDDGTSEDVEPKEVKTISIHVGTNKSEISFTWLSNSSQDSFVKIYKDKGLLDEFYEFEAIQNDNKLDDLGYYSYSVVADCFDKAGTYYYKVGNDEEWSDLEELIINNPNDNTYSFLFSGDPQIGSSNVSSDQKGWENTLDLASNWFSGKVDFLLSAGDQVNASRTGYLEDEYDAYFSPRLLANLPSAVNVGNHEAYTYSTYSEHFTVPSNVDSSTISSSAGEQSGNYWFEYEGTLFISLNSNSTSTALHKTFMEEAISEFKKLYGEPKWQIVTFHHSIYSTASHYADSSILVRRDELSGVFSDLNID